MRNNFEVPPLIAGKDGLKRNGASPFAKETMDKTSRRLSEIIIANGLEDLLDGIDDYSHIMVFYWGHQISGAGRNLKKIHPAGLENYPLKGIFATCSPARPNPVLMTVVRLTGICGNRLSVEGFDAIDNSPVLDIKPFVPELLPQDGVYIADWMKKILEEFEEN